LIQQDKINLIKIIFDDLLNIKYYFALYGGKFLKSAIEQNNVELMDVIFKKTIEYFKENQKNHFYILSIISNNIPYLKNHPEFILRYHNEVPFILYPSNKKIIYNNFNHLYSSCIELEINELFVIPLFISYREKIYSIIQKILLLLPIFMVVGFFGFLYFYYVGLEGLPIHLYIMPIIAIICIIMCIIPFYKKFKKYKKYIVLLIKISSILSFILGSTIEKLVILVIGLMMAALPVLLYTFYLTYEKKKG